MDFDNLLTLAISFVICISIGIIGSCTYASNVNYNDCVRNAPLQSAKYCKMRMNNGS